MQDILAALRKVVAPVEQLAAHLISIPEWFEKFAKQAAERMVTGVYWGNARSWRQAAKEAMQGREIYTALQVELRGEVGIRYRELIEANASLIKSLPYEAAIRAVQVASSAAQSGERAESISGESIFRHVLGSRAMLIARTETSKANAALTEARSESLGLGWYLWRTSEDGRVRASHRFMSDILIPYSNAPAPELLKGIKSTLGHYHAGNAPNDRCYQEPFLRYSQVKWPHKVYWDGTVRWMPLYQFKQLGGVQGVAA